MFDLALTFPIDPILSLLRTGLQRVKDLITVVVTTNTWDFYVARSTIIDHEWAYFSQGM